MVIERSQIGGQQHHQFRHAQLVHRSPVGLPVGGAVGRAARRTVGRTDPLQPPDDVISQVTDHPAGQRWQTGQRFGVQQPQRLGQGAQRITAGGQADGRLTQPVRVTVPFGQCSGRRHPDERPPGPGVAVLRRFQQEGAGAVPRQCRVQADRGDRVGQQPHRDRDDPPITGELTELLPAGGDLAEGALGAARGRRRGHRHGGHCAGRTVGR